MHKENLFVEGNIRQESLATIWHRPGGFAYNREFTPEQLGGFCSVCRYREICRGGCSWTAYSHTNNRFDNPYCFYRQAVKHQRFDLLDELPTQPEVAYYDKPENRDDPMR
jgi:radical SAM protein with 4Fe4S-binding SPASM domain